MSAPSNQQLGKLIQSMIVERQRLLIREANYLRGLVGLPPVKALDNDRHVPDDGKQADPRAHKQ